jgi:uncharacterized damage-inducible protein DinB
MITQHLIQIFERDLNRLRNEIELYASDEQLWRTAGSISNSGGNLCLHLVGNLQHFLGTVLGNTGYRRNRDAEFALKNVSRQKLLDEIDSTKTVVTDVLEQVTSKEMYGNYPLLYNEETVTTEFFLMHLACHLSYHLGQINYHRRMTV